MMRDEKAGVLHTLRSYIDLGRIGDSVLYFSLALTPVVGSTPALVGTLIGSALSLLNYNMGPLEKYKEKKREYRTLSKKIEQECASTYTSNENYYSRLRIALNDEDKQQLIGRKQEIKMQITNRLERLETALERPDVSELTNFQLTLDTVEEKHDDLMVKAKRYMKFNSAIVIIWASTQITAVFLIDPCADTKEQESWKKHLSLTLPFLSGFVFCSIAFLSYYTRRSIESHHRDSFSQLKEQRSSLLTELSFHKKRALDSLDSQGLLIESVKAKKIELQILVLKHHVASKIRELRVQAAQYQLPVEEEIKLTEHIISNEDLLAYRGEIKNLKSVVELLKRDEPSSDEKEAKQSRKKSNVLSEEEVELALPVRIWSAANQPRWGNIQSIRSSQSDFSFT